jgi:hypothetical protein
MYRSISAYPFYYNFIINLHYHFISALAEYQS